MAIPNDTTLVNLNRPYVFNGWYPTGFVDQFIRKISFQKLDQPTTKVTWNRATAFPTVSPYVAPPGGGGLGQNPMDVETGIDQPTLTLQRIGDSALVDQLSQDSSGNTNDLLATQIHAKKIGIIRELGNQILQGNGTAPNLKGLDNLVTAAQSYTGGGLSTIIIDLNFIINCVRASDGAIGSGADCIVMHERVLRFLVQGYGILNILDSAFDSDLGVPVVRYRGIPIYIGQIPESGANEYAIWALKIKGPTGIRIVHATGRSDSFGIEVMPIPLQPTTGQSGAFVGGLYGLMVPEEQSIARLTGITSGMLNAAQIIALPP